MAMYRTTTQLLWGTLIVLGVFVFSTATVHALPPGQLPQTGQTTCYDSAGTAIPCAGTGQDGEVQAGVVWPNPRFIDNSDGTITDNLTGLIWLKDANCFGYKSWQESLDAANSLASGSCSLADGSDAGDWRLPNVVEIQSLIDLSSGRFPNPAIPIGHPFSNVGSSRQYWTSTTDTNSINQFKNAYHINLGGGYISSWSKTTVTPMAVWPVRGSSNGIITIRRTGQTGCWDTTGNAINCSGTGQDGDKQQGAIWPSIRFTDNGNGTLTDNLTGLVWLKNANCFNTKTWDQALTAANGLVGDNSQCGLTDGSTAGNWRVPNVNELLSLINFQEKSYTWHGKQGFINTPIASYWASDNYAANFAKKWSVSTIDWSSLQSSTSTLYVHPVRNPYPVLSVSPISKNFGVVAADSSSDLVPITIANNGEAPLVVSSIAASGEDSDMFSLNVGDGANGTCGSLTPIIQPHSNCKFYVAFSPKSDGGKATTLRISSNSNSASEIAVSLQGGIPLPAYVVDTFVIGDGGGITCNSPVIEGGTDTCHVTPNSGFEVSTITGCGGTLNGDTYTTGTVTADCTVTVAFFAVYDYPLYNGDATLRCNTPVSRALTSSCSSVNGSYSCLLNLSLATSAPPAVCRIIPLSRSAFSNATGCSGVYSGTTYVTGQINPSCSLRGTLSGTQSYTITANVSGGEGTINCSSPSYYGETATCSITPNTGYHLISLTDNAVEMFASMSGNSYTITNVTANHTISGFFAPNPVNASCGSANNGIFAAAPTSNLCTIGTASIVAGTGSWNWTCSGEYGGTPASCSALLGVYLNLSFAGTGGGSVSGDISCTSGNACSSPLFLAGSTVNLLSAPNAISTFAGWSGACSTLSGNCLVTMNDTKDVTATFNRAPKAKIDTTEYDSLGAAYADAATIATILALDSVMADTGMILNQSKSITIRGGYKADYSGRSGLPTLLNGPLKVTKGKLAVDRLVVK